MISYLYRHKDRSASVTLPGGRWTYGEITASDNEQAWMKARELSHYGVDIELELYRKVFSSRSGTFS